MADTVTIHVNGQPLEVPAGATLAAALMAGGQTGLRRSVAGEMRGPLCGMGICFECRVTVDGRRHVKSCQTACRPGMAVEIDAD